MPLAVAAPAGLRWFDCTPVLVTADEGRLAPDPDEPMVVAGRDAVAEPALPTLPDGLLTAPEVCAPVTLSLIDGVVLTTVDLLVVLPLVAVPLVADVTLFGVVLPAVACDLVVVLPATVLFLLTVLLLPMPPLSEVPLPNTLSDPV